MNKIPFCIIALLSFFVNANAQFVGYYNLHDGGVDMPNSSLYILPNNEFVLFYYAGYKEGKWHEMDKNSISLTETKTMTNPYLLYGEEGTSETFNVDVYGLYRAQAHIEFSRDTISHKQYQPIFNEWPNCLADDYSIRKKKEDYNWVTLTLPKNPDFGRFGNKYPYNAMSYTFPLNKKYSNYTVLYNEDVTRGNFEIILNKKGNNYSVYGEKKLEREKLTEIMIKEIENAKIEIDKSYDFSRYGDQIPTSANAEIIIYKPTIEPLFTSYCNDENQDTAENKNNEETTEFVATDRENGFYTVLNFDESDYSIEKYELAKTPSLTRNDVLEFQKIVSDYGGYELEIIFTETGTAKFSTLTAANIGKPIVIVVNKFIVSAPIINSEISGGRANITGINNENELDEIVMEFKKE